MTDSVQLRINRQWTSETDRSGRKVRRRRKTRKTPKILGLCLAVSEITMSSRDTNTRMPSITFQPLLRYEWRPSTKPFATTCTKQYRAHLYTCNSIASSHNYKYCSLLNSFRLHRMHEMQTIVTDVRGVCPSVCQSVCHECTEWPRKAKRTRDSASLCGVIRCSLCHTTLATCLSMQR